MSVVVAEEVNDDDDDDDDDDDNESPPPQLLQEERIDPILSMVDVKIKLNKLECEGILLALAVNKQQQKIVEEKLRLAVIRAEANQQLVECKFHCTPFLCQKVPCCFPTSNPKSVLLP